MAGNVVALPGVCKPTNGEPQPHVIARCEKLLEDAKSGRVQFIAFACYAPDDSILYSWTEKGNSLRALAAVSRLFFRFNLAIDHEAEDNG